MAEMTLAAVARGLTPRADQPGVFSGYASLFGTVDSQGDLVERGAFAPALAAWRAKGRRPAMLWQHDHAEPIGLWTGIEEDATGLRVEGRLLLAVRAGAEAYEHLKAGTVTGLSIGYQAIESRRDRKTGLRFLSKVNLWEISLVTFPANDEARVAQVKTDEETRDRLARALQRIFLTRPVLPFEGKNARNYLRVHGHPEPRDDIGRFADGGTGGSIRATRLADRPASRPRGVDRAPSAPALPPGIDWGKIREWEGRRVHGYVPLDARNRPVGGSGVTFGTGLDTGQWNEEGFERSLDIRPPSLKAEIKEILRPFFREQGARAVALLDEASRRGRAELTEDQTDALDAAVFDYFTRNTRKLYDQALAAEPGPRRHASFDALPTEARTIAVSLAFQHGVEGARSSPRIRPIWRALVEQRWGAAAAGLRALASDPRYTHRRRRAKEATVLQSLVDRLSEGVRP